MFLWDANIFDFILIVIMSVKMNDILRNTKLRKKKNQNNLMKRAHWTPEAVSSAFLYSFPPKLIQVLWICMFNFSSSHLKRKKKKVILIRTTTFWSSLSENLNGKLFFMLPIFFFFAFFNFFHFPIKSCFF